MAEDLVDQDVESRGESAAYVRGHQPLSPSSYPVWISAFGLLVLLAFGYSSLSLPNNLSLAWTLARAKQFDRAHDFTSAEREFGDVLRVAPDSKSARLGMAHALFGDRDPANDRTALALLEGVHLDASEWAELEPVMPAEYQTMFVRESR